MRKPKKIFFLLLLLTPFGVWAQPTSQIFSVHDGHLWASIDVSNPPRQRIIESMREGLESEVQFNLRVYERNKGLFSFLGDKLVADWRRVRRARWDEFSGEFLITTAAGGSRQMRAAPSFLSTLFHLKTVDTGIRLASGHNYYVLSNVQIQIVRLVPPLTMIALFLPHRQIDTPWVETEIEVK